MKNENIMSEHIGAIKSSIINKQIEKGNLLADRFFHICAQFIGF